MNIKKFLKNNIHILFILYLPIYLFCFSWLESRTNIPFAAIHCIIDDWIPFCEILIIPYLLWFLYVTVVLVYLYFQKKHLEDYYCYVITLFLGMSTCLFIYLIFPNAQNMRPAEFSHPNIFTDIIRFIYAKDTNTNVLPSIHVYNAIATHVAFASSHGFRNCKWIKRASLTLCSLICLSTMFLKQHSFLDVITALGLFMIYSPLVYRFLPKYFKKTPED